MDRTSMSRSHESLAGLAKSEIFLIWREAGVASPRDQLEFGAKVFGFAGGAPGRAFAASTGRLRVVVTSRRKGR